jgi:hypothetical protein
MEKMKIKINRVRGTNLAEIISDEVLIHETQDAIDLMGESNYLGSRKIIMNEKNVIPEFFDLKTGIAGEILQKFSTYHMKVAIVGDYSKYASKSLRDFISESNRHGQINFVSSIEEARERLIG